MYQGPEIMPYICYFAVCVYRENGFRCRAQRMRQVRAPSGSSRRPICSASGRDSTRTSWNHCWRTAGHVSWRRCRTASSTWRASSPARSSCTRRSTSASRAFRRRWPPIAACPPPWSSRSLTTTAFFRGPRAARCSAPTTRSTAAPGPALGCGSRRYTWTSGRSTSTRRASSRRRAPAPGLLTLLLVHLLVPLLLRRRSASRAQTVSWWMSHSIRRVRLLRQPPPLLLPTRDPLGPSDLTIQKSRMH